MEPYDQVILAFISSNITGKNPLIDILLDENSQWFKETKLRVSSVLKLNKLVTVEKNIIKIKLGIVPEEILTEVDKKLKVVLKLK